MNCKLAWASFLFAGVAAAKPVAIDFRAQVPKPGAETPPPPPKIERATLDNGLTLLVHERHDVPFVVVRALLVGGDAQAPKGKAGLAAFTAEMLQAGTSRHRAPELADALASLGAELQTGSSTETSAADLSTLKAKLPVALALLGEVVVEPSFPATEIERVRVRRHSQILERADDPAEVIADVMPQVVFGEGHPYASLHLGTPASLATFTRGDVLAFHRAYYRPGSAALIFVGDVTLAEARALAEKSPFARWAKGSAVLTDAPAAPKPHGGVILVDKPDAPQSQVGLVLPTIARLHPDFVALSIADACFGGTFSSRLNLTLREARGYTYGAFSGVRWHRGPSLLFASAGIRADVTLPAMGEFWNELRRLGSTPPTPSEIDLAKAQLIHGVTFAFETMHEAAHALSELFVFHLPLDYFERYVRDVEKATPADVQRAIAQHLPYDRATMVIVGDRREIEPHLHLQLRDAFGIPTR